MASFATVGEALRRAMCYRSCCRHRDSDFFDARRSGAALPAWDDPALYGVTSTCRCGCMALIVVRVEATVWSCRHRQSRQEIPAQVPAYEESALELIHRLDHKDAPNITATAVHEGVRGGQGIARI